MNVTYASYLKVDELISLQHCLSDGPEHDELLFITIHQVYELWFQQLLHEGSKLVHLLGENRLNQAQHTLKRMLKILKTMVNQVDILDTMTPLEFLSFRKFLSNSSGFQSYQFRELEYFLGKKDRRFMTQFKEEPEILAKLEKRLQAPSLWREFLGMLLQRGFAIPAEVIEAPIDEPTKESVELQALLLDVYRHHSDLAGLCESLVDLDEGLQEWRYRHVKMVQRTIGSKSGTGGSAGAEYLKTTLFQPLFSDLWTIRSQF
ncbi:tryptophan 2,3-dioxygenase [Algicola sagamiensis]|uniref:tryptophan 2,3-dioxygenase n=1 Tax=Algicola sagamiensis TaxID=163869 RepID=UPI00037EFCCE|nr:tryptophan 2,3-dioxygenase family protein [Algicola sagamiensis]